MPDSVRLAEKSSVGCAVISWHDQLIVAWTGTDLHVNLASSPDGRILTGKQRLAQTSYESHRSKKGYIAVPLSPSLTVSGGQLYLGEIQLALHLPAVGQPMDAVQATAEESGCRPSLETAGNGNPMRAWRDAGGHINVKSWAGPPVRLEEARTRRAPALCSHQGSLILAWTGTDHHLHLARLP
jgi:hypothetical protein